MAAQNGHAHTVKVLVKKQGVEPNLQDKFGNTPLHMAAQNGHAHTVKVLVEEQGIALSLKNQDDETPLSLAASFDRADIVKVLVEKENHVFDFDPRQGVFTVGVGTIERIHRASGLAGRVSFQRP